MPWQELVGIVVGPCCSTPGASTCRLIFQNGMIVKDIIDIGNGAKRPAEVGRKFFLTLKSKLREILFDVRYRSVSNLLQLSSISSVLLSRCLKSILK